MLFKRWGEICQDISEYSLVYWLFKLVPIVYSSVEGTFSFRKLKSQSRSRTVLTKEVGFSVSFFRMLTFIGYFMKDFKSIIIGRFYCWHRIDVSLICASLVQICKAWQILDFGDLRYLWFFLFCYYFLKNLSRQGILCATLQTIFHGIDSGSYKMKTFWFHYLRFTESSLLCKFKQSRLFKYGRYLKSLALILGFLFIWITFHWCLKILNDLLLEEHLFSSNSVGFNGMLSK